MMSPLPFLPSSLHSTSSSVASGKLPAQTAGFALVDYG